MLFLYSEKDAGSAPGHFARSPRVSLGLLPQSKTCRTRLVPHSKMKHVYECKYEWLLVSVYDPVSDWSSVQDVTPPSSDDCWHWFDSPQPLHLPATM